MINVARLMSNPRYCQPIPILRRTVTMEAGVASYPETPETISGSVQPGDGETLKLLPEGTELVDVIVVYTAADLRAAPAGGYGDIVLDSGRRYAVNAIDQAFRRYGYNRAVCVAESVTGALDAE